MATIDTSVIEGFDAMSDAEKVKALLSLNVPDTKKLKADLEKAKKELVGKRTAEEQAAADQAQAMADLTAKYELLERQHNELIKKSTIAEHKAQYIANGYTAELAEKAAVALQAGDSKTLFECLAAHNAEQEKNYKANALKGMGNVSGSMTTGGDTDAGVDFAKQLAAKYGSSAGSASLNEYY